MDDSLPSWPPGPVRSPDAGATRKLRRVTLYGLGVNLLLCVVKGAAGWFSQSQALIADAVHSLSDTATDLAVLVGIDYWTAPADDCHPHGHGRIETLVSFFIGCTLALVALGLIHRAITTLHLRHAETVGWTAFVAALLSLACKEALYRWTAEVGRQLKSTALIANAWHHRSDALSSVPVAIAVLGTKLYPGLMFLDHIAAVVVSALLIRAAWDISWPSLRQLVDAGVDRSARRDLTDIAREVAGVVGVHALRTRHIGPGLQVDLHVLVDPAISVRAGHDIATAVCRLLESGPDVVDVLVHVEPSDLEHSTTVSWSSQDGAGQGGEERMFERIKVLFLCTGNSCRSQMAEGWARELRGDVLEPFSAGIETHGLNPHAVRVMGEAGVDISGQRSKAVEELAATAFDYVVTVCAHAHETCPVFPGDAKVVHVGFDDPPNLAQSASSEDEILDCYRRVRDEIRAFIETLPEGLTRQD